METCEDVKDNDQSYTLDGSKSGFVKYTSNFGNYIKRLSGKNQDSSEDCVFCEFDLNITDGYYEKDDGREIFVAESSVHERIWDSGLILTYNPNGWHIINELILPRRHEKMDHIITYLDEIFTIASSRWELYEEELESIHGINVDDLRYALVANVRSGQSVDHAHTHCYVSDYDVPDLFNKTVSVCDLRVRSLSANLSFAPLDHPPIVIEMNPDCCVPESLLAGAIQEATEIAVRLLVELFETLPPMSIGCFYSDGKYTVISYPIQRRGTIQHFQEGRFQKFSTTGVQATLRERLKRLEGLSYNEDG